MGSVANINYNDNPISQLVFYVNGKLITDDSADPEITLLTYLREKLKLCGTKLGCGEGGCGACTVMVSRMDREENVVRHYAVNACLFPVCAVHGMAVTTVEGIGNTRTRLHPVQERIAKAHGSQCGFCTPGFVMSMYALLRSSPTPSMKEMEIAFQGNLCRCTGYRPIIEGYRTFTKEYQCAMGDQCCKNKKANGSNGVNGVNGENGTVNGKVNGTTNGTNGQIETPLFEAKKFMPYDPSQDPIFPPSLRLSDQYDRQDLVFKSNRTTWYRPTSLESVLKLKSEFPNAKIVVGNSEIGVEVKFKNFHYPVLICVNQVKELNSIEIVENGVKVGAAVSLNRVEKVLKNEIKERSEFQTRIFKAIVKMFHYFAGNQIRNVASMGGAIMTGSPISDLNPILMAANVELKVESAKTGRRLVKMDKKFFTGYRRNVLQPDEVLLSVFVPFTTERQHFFALKQAKRRDDDIAIVNIALNVLFENNPKRNIVKSMEIAYGGMAPWTMLVGKTKELAIGREWNSEFVEDVNRSLIEELPLSEDAPGGMISYRRSLTLSLFFKCYLMISKELSLEIAQRELSGTQIFETLTPESTQFYKKHADHENLTVGEPIIHNSALKQATGEALYCDDIPKYENECYMALVLSTKAHAKLVSIDPSVALAMEGVLAFYSAKDLPEHCNITGPVFKDEEVFISKTVTSIGQNLGVIVAETQKIAQAAARLVKVEYEEISPIIVTIEDAIKHNSFLSNDPQKIEIGNVEEAFKNADHVVEGEFRMGGQEHFYLETHASLAVAQDGDEIKLFCSTQNPSEIQRMISHALDIPCHKIVTTVKRLGGGFGGKETRAYLVAVPACIASYKLQRPVRCMLDRDEDMLITGTRHPAYAKYKVAFNNDGRICGFEVKAYINAGYSMDLSFSVLDRVCLHILNCYKIENIKVEGWMCKTNLPSNTAFRGFGGPQGMIVSEAVIRDICRVTKRSYVEVADINLLRAGDKTFYDQPIEDNNLDRCFKKLLTTSAYEARKKKIEDFNKANRWRKKGISIVNIQYGVAFGIPFLNQGGALVMIYLDGSVLVTHGGIEMGQGLHIKMLQVAATTLDVPIEKVFISETTTDKVPNTSPTAASMGSDLNGMAVLNACAILSKRIQKYRDNFPELSWDKWVEKAYLDRVSLSAVGYYGTPNLAPYPSKEEGTKYSYFTFGSACSEVEIDCLTGDHQVIQTDIVMDVGSSLNPAIDIGQIEGAFMQGYGLFTLEEMVYSPSGQVFSRGPGAYKLPGYADIPGKLNVSLLSDAKNPRAVFSSKAVGEPPLFSAASVFFAIKEAIGSAREEEGLSPHFDLISPATASRIRMACHDKITKEFQPKREKTPWNIMP